MKGGLKGSTLPAVATFAGGSRSDLLEGEHFASDSAKIMSARQRYLRLTAHELGSQEPTHALSEAQMVLEAQMVCCNTGMMK